MRILVVTLMALVFAGCEATVKFSPKEPVSANVETLSEAEIQLQKINTYRASKGIGPLVLNDKLRKAAFDQASYMAKHDTVSHGQGWFSSSTAATRAAARGYSWTIIAENVAGGQETFDAVFEAWKRSPGHNENLLNPAVRDIGVAEQVNLGTRYKHFWAMVLGAE